MYFIQHIESISYQNTFGKTNFWNELKPLDEQSTLLSPDYKNYIAPNTLRRLSTILRIGITCAKACSENINKDFDAISVGTSLGCLTDTEKFLVTINTVSGDILSPTAFIQSTHNTIAGQISLELKNHSYNMTHTQNCLSFETALLDGMMCIDEGKNNVLIGAADESISFMERLRGNLIDTPFPFTTLGTFFVMSNQPTNQSKVALLKSSVFFNKPEAETIENFIVNHTVDAVIETGDRFLKLSSNHSNVLLYSGYNQSASAFAFHLAVDRLTYDNKVSTILVINNLDKGKLGLTLLQKHVS